MIKYFSYLDNKQIPTEVQQKYPQIKQIFDSLIQNLFHIISNL